MQNLCVELHSSVGIIIILLYSSKYQQIFRPNLKKYLLVFIVFLLYMTYQYIDIYIIYNIII
jgi:hypothetical protein